MMREPFGRIFEQSENVMHLAGFQRSKGSGARYPENTVRVLSETLILWGIWNNGPIPIMAYTTQPVSPYDGEAQQTIYMFLSMCKGGLILQVRDVEESQSGKKSLPRRMSSPSLIENFPRYLGIVDRNDVGPQDIDIDNRGICTDMRSV